MACLLVGVISNYISFLDSPTVSFLLATDAMIAVTSLASHEENHIRRCCTG